MTQTTLETRTVKIGGRDITVTRVSETQALLISREAVLLQKDGITRDRLVRGMSRVLDAIESLVVLDDDREWITDQMLTGKLELTDLMDIVKAFKDDAPATVTAKPAVRRGRPPKNRG